MEDTTNNPTNGQDPAEPNPLAIDAADLLISSQAAWDAAPPPKFADACDSLCVFGINRNWGDTASIPVECHSWDHQRCAEQHAVGELRKLHRVVGDVGEVFYATVPVADFAPARLSDRRYELAKTEDVVWYRWYRRDDGTVWVIASHPLGGRKPPAEFRPTEIPLKIAAVALRQPGVNRADGTNLAREADAVEGAGGSQVVWIGTANEERWEETKRAAAVEAMDRYGVEVDPRHAVTLQAGITPDEWIECLKAVRFRKE